MKKVKLCAKLVIVLTILTLLAPGPKPALANMESSTSGQVAWIVGGSLATAAALYLVWLNRPANQDKMDWSSRGPGGFFVGAFTGGSLVQSTEWRLNPGHQLTNLLPYNVRTSRVDFQSGVVGGLKLGYFCHRFPYLGVEGEFNYTRNDVRGRQATINPPILGNSQIQIHSERFYSWTLALHLLARYGFLPDQEVPFGRLQPYVGIGPGFVPVYGELDSAKNLSLEVLAGLRYMLLRNLSIFAEYKFSHQWDIVFEHDRMNLIGGPEYRFQSHFPFTSHKIVVGLAFHFL
jgi:opacity protein-like surface antigen